MILDQQGLDDAVHDLLKKLSEVYAFMIEDGRVDKIATMQELYGKLARQTLECADFIVHYSETKSARKSSLLRSSPLDTQCVISYTVRRLARNVFKETGASIQCYNDVLDALMKQCRDGAGRVNAGRDNVVNAGRDNVVNAVRDIVVNAVRDIVVNVYYFGKSGPRFIPNIH